MRGILENFSNRVLEDLRNPRIAIPLAVLVLAIITVLVVMPAGGQPITGELSATGTVGGQSTATAVKLIPVSEREAGIGMPVPYGTPDPFRSPPVKHTTIGTSPSTTGTSSTTSSSTITSTPPATSTGSTSSGSGTAAGNGASSGSRTTSGSSGAQSTGGTSTSHTGTTPDQPAKPVFTFFKNARVNLHFGVAGGPRKLFKRVRGNTPFPSNTNAAVVFVGRLAKRRVAVFLPARGAVASGPGKCLPSRTNCEYFELTPGEREHVLAEQHGGGSTLYSVVYASKKKHS
jgi:hypothetical protein